MSEAKLQLAKDCETMSAIELAEAIEILTEETARRKGAEGYIFFENPVSRWRWDGKNLEVFRFGSDAFVPSIYANPMQLALEVRCLKEIK